MYGDDEVIRRRVGQLREQGAAVRSLADELAARTESLSWRGRAAAAMRERVTERAHQLRTAAEGHDRAADALAQHLQVVVESKDEIAAIQDRAQRILDGRPDLAGVELPPPGHLAWRTLELPGL